MRLGAPQRLQRRDPLQRLAAGQVEDDRVPGGGRDVVRVLLAGSGRGSRRGCPRAARRSARSTSASSSSRSILPRATSRLYRPFSGRTSAYCRSTSCSAGGVPVEAVAAAVALQQLQLGDPVELAGQLIGSLASRCSTDSQRSRTSRGLLVGVGAEAVLDVLAGQLEVLHLELDGGELAAVAQRDQVLAASGRARPARRVRTGLSTARSTVMKPSSIMARTSAVVPSLR